MKIALNLHITCVCGLVVRESNITVFNRYLLIPLFSMNINGIYLITLTILQHSWGGRSHDIMHVYVEQLASLVFYSMWSNSGNMS